MRDLGCVDSVTSGLLALSCRAGMGIECTVDNGRKREEAERGEGGDDDSKMEVDG